MGNPRHLDLGIAWEGIMTQKLLIAVDDSENAQRAVDFVAKSFARGNQVTLLSIVLDTESLSKMESPELTPFFKSQRAIFCILEDKKRELIKAAAKKAREKLLSAGFAPEMIEVKVQNKKRGVARDILAEAEKGYDLVILGRRGISGIQEFFMGSTSYKVFNGAKDISVLIVN
jgi:nucleotide-binding universal stress UspA family protein